ncbi:MAG: anti-sigma factor family protein [Sulfuriferula sp.]
MLNCKEASCLVSESQERRLNFRERWALRLHLWMCVGCTRFERQLRLLRKAMTILKVRTETDRVDFDMPAPVRERIRKALLDQDDTGIHPPRKE